MKSKSISRRLTVQVMGLILSFSIVLLLANSLLLKPLYYYSVKMAMLEGMDALTEVEFEDEHWKTVINDVDPGHGYDITIEEFGQVIYSSSREIGIRGPDDFEHKEPPELKTDIKRPFIPIEFVKDWYWAKDDVQMGTLHDEKEGTHLFIAKKNINQDTVIYITQGVEPILNSVRQANVLLVSVSVIFLIIAAFMVMFISKRFTQPVRQMQSHVNALAHLNFEEQLQVHTGDELESLSEDIQILAIKLKEALAVLQKQNRQLEKDVESQRKFISNASHELRTPLSLIKGYADEIAQGFVKDREQEHIYVGYISEESSKMKRLLNEILELSRIESGYMEFHYENISLKQGIESFIEKYYGFIEDHQLKIILELIEGEGEVDLVRFEQVLANFLSNAAKYSDGSKEVIIRMEDIGVSYRISVINEGQVMTRKVMDHMWDSFYKADESRSSNKGSYGLGLSIVRAIQEVAGQEYGCYNDGKKIVFWFDIKKMAYE